MFWEYKIQTIFLTIEKALKVGDEECIKPLTLFLPLKFGFHAMFKFIL